MPLEILLILVVGGIAGIALALHLLGMSAQPPLTDAGVRDSWIRHFPGDDVRAVRLSKNGQAALISTPSGAGVVWRFGADTVARRLPCAHVADHKLGLRLTFGETGAPGVTLKLGPNERDTWREEIAQS